MPSTSEDQRRAMQAAAHGESSIGIPQSVGQEYVAADHVARQTGLPAGKRKTHRGGGRGKGKGGPGASHHNALNKAMAEGDHATAKKHALNLANALHGHVSGKVPRGTSAVSPLPNSPSNGLVAPSKPPAAVAPPSSGMGFLASALMRKR